MRQVESANTTALRGCLLGSLCDLLMLTLERAEGLIALTMKFGERRVVAVERHGLMMVAGHQISGLTQLDLQGLPSMRHG
jgi:hypothetical protein